MEIYLYNFVFLASHALFSTVDAARTDAQSSGRGCTKTVSPDITDQPTARAEGSVALLTADSRSSEIGDTFLIYLNVWQILDNQSRSNYLILFNINHQVTHRITKSLLLIPTENVTGEWVDGEYLSKYTTGSLLPLTLFPSDCRYVQDWTLMRFKFLMLSITKCPYW